MTQQPRSRTHAAIAPAFTLLAALLLAIASVLWLGAGVASAHDELVSSDPAEGAQLDAAPETATLEFSGNVQEVGTELALQNGNGAAVALPEGFALSGTKVTQPLPELSDGNYSLNWRVVSEDGHPISGTVSFTVGEAADSENLQGGFDNVPVDPDDIDFDAQQEEQSGMPPWLVGILSFVGVLVIGGAGFGMLMRMKQQERFIRGNKPTVAEATNSDDADPATSEPDES